MIPDPEFKFRDRPKCPNRRSYKSLSAAKTAAEIASKRGLKLVAYICPRCGWAHLGPAGKPVR